MINVAKDSTPSDKKPFVKPELVELDVRGTQSAPVFDPNEFSPFIGPTS